MTFGRVGQLMVSCKHNQSTSKETPMISISSKAFRGFDASVARSKRTLASLVRLTNMPIGEDCQ